MSEINNSVSVDIMFCKFVFECRVSLIELIFFQAVCWTALSTKIALLDSNRVLIFLIVFYSIKIEL